MSPPEWLAARKELLKKEKEFSKLRDELSRLRREMLSRRGGRKEDDSRAFFDWRLRRAFPKEAVPSTPALARGSMQPHRLERRGLRRRLVAAWEINPWDPKVAARGGRVPRAVRAMRVRLRWVRAAGLDTEKEEVRREAREVIRDAGRAVNPAERTIESTARTGFFAARFDPQRRNRGFTRDNGGRS